MATGDFAAMERPPAANVLASVGAHQYKTRWAGRAPGVIQSRFIDHPAGNSLRT